MFIKAMAAKEACGKSTFATAFMVLTSRWVVVFCVFLVLALVRPSALLAANRFLDAVRNQLGDAAIALTNEGFEITHEPYTGQLDNRATYVVTYRLARGMEYGFVAVCDQDCSDLDLALYDENDNLIASDLEMDDNPVVTVTPRWTGQFKLVLTMVNCRNEPCYYGVGAFGQ